MTDLADLQQRITAWHSHRFPHAVATNVALKLCEEAGEVGRAINGTEGTHSATGYGDVGEEAADVLIAILALLGRWYPDVDITACADAKVNRMAAAATVTPTQENT